MINSLKKGKISKEEALLILDQLDSIGFRMSLELYKKIKETIEGIKK